MQYQDHEKTATFRRMAHGEASPAEIRQIVRHLLGGCARCQKAADKVRREVSYRPDWNYDQAFDRVQQRLSRALKPSSPPRLRTRTRPGPRFGVLAAAHR